MKILITGGAGFIGTHLTRRLLTQGHSITILDSFLPQVHGARQELAADLQDNVRLVRGDVADGAALERALSGAQCVIHLAAETGTGQSMYEVARYGRTNLTGTVLLYDLLVRGAAKDLERMVVASSRAVYGEGAYRCDRDGVVYPNSRPAEDKEKLLFDPICPVCGGECSSIATPEEAPLRPSSFYGLTKLTQEQMVLLFGQVLGIPSIALRYQNVYGPGQSLQNPYTGILAVFSNLARVGQPIRVFEDGMESRDFVYIDDVVTATATALLAPMEGCHTINVGSGERTTVLEVAERINAYFGSRATLQVTGAFREGDIRHNFADLTRAQQLLGHRPAWSFHEGLKRFLAWAEQSSPSTEGYERSLGEMRDRGLLRD